MPKLLALVVLHRSRGRSLGPEPQQRQQFGQIDQTLRLGAFLGGQRLAGVLPIKQRLKRAATAAGNLKRARSAGGSIASVSGMNVLPN